MTEDKREKKMAVACRLEGALAAEFKRRAALGQKHSEIMRQSLIWYFGLDKVGPC